MTQSVGNVRDFPDLDEDDNNGKVLKRFLNFEDPFFCRQKCFSTHKNVFFHLQRRNTTFCRHKNDVRKVFVKSQCLLPRQRKQHDTGLHGGNYLPPPFHFEKKRIYISKSLKRRTNSAFCFTLNLKIKNRLKDKTFFVQMTWTGVTWGVPTGSFSKKSWLAKVRRSTTKKAR